MTDEQAPALMTDIETHCREAAKHFDRDVHLHYNRKEDAWTIAVGDREIHFTAVAAGYGKTIQAAMKAMRPVSKMRRRILRPR